MTHEGTQQLSRRDLLMRGATVVGSAAVASAIPFSDALGARRPTEPLAPLTAEARIAQAKREIQEMRERGFSLPDTTKIAEKTKRMEPEVAKAMKKIEEADEKGLPRPEKILPETNGYIQPFELLYPRGFKPGDRIDRGLATKKKGKYGVYARVDDFWLEQEGLDFVMAAKERRAPLAVGPVEGAFILYPNLMLEMANNKSFFFNHGKAHDPYNQWATLSYPEIVADVLPNMDALNNLNRTLLINWRHVIDEQMFVAPPYGSGAIPGYQDYDPDLKRVAKNFRSATLGWTIDNLVWQEGITEDQMFDILRANLVPGAITIWHPDSEGKSTRVFQRFADYVRGNGYEFRSLAELPHTRAVGS